MLHPHFTLPALLFAVIAFPALSVEQGSAPVTPQQQFEVNKQRLLNKIDSGDTKLKTQRDCIAKATTPEAIRNCRPAK